MAKKKISKKRAARRTRKITSRVDELMPALTMPVEVVLVPVPVEKTKQSEWHKWVDWIWK